MKLNLAPFFSANSVYHACRTNAAFAQTAELSKGSHVAMTGNLSRRSFLKSTAAVGLGCVAELGGIARAPAAKTINFATWSAAVDTVKSHLAAFDRN
jgi:TAT (twin-arginine translocation) pathway signal sequence